MSKFTIAFLIGFIGYSFADEVGGHSSSMMTGKAVAFSYQVSRQEKIIYENEETVTLSPTLTKNQIRSTLDQLLKTAIDNPTAENVRQYILVQTAAKKQINSIEVAVTPPTHTPKAYLVRTIRQSSFNKPLHKKANRFVASPRATPRLPRSKIQPFHYVWV